MILHLMRWRNTLGTDIIDASLTGGQQVTKELGSGNETALVARGEKAIRADGAMLWELHTLLKQKDIAYGGLIRVRNKRQQFMWVHLDFEGEY